jgi:hypothetical protein
MAYGELRFLYENLISSASMLTLSSHADGRLSSVVKDGDGSATMLAYGPYQGEIDLYYTIEIDSVSAGAELGYATFRWRTSNTAVGTWEQTGVTTQTTPAIALSADGLGTNIKVSFAGGDGDDFEVGDKWHFDTRANYGSERLLDRNRNTYWQSSGIVTEHIVIDYGAATQFTAVLICDHNLTDSAVVKIQANASDSWGSPSYDNTISTITDPLIVYADQTYRYNRWYFEDSTNPDGCIKIGNIMHTTYLALEQCNAWWGSGHTPGLKLQESESEPGYVRRYLYASQNGLALDMGETLSSNDVDSLIAMQEAIIDTATHQILPLWVHLFYDETDTLRLMDWRNIADWQRQYAAYLLNSGTSLTFNEVVKTE